MNSIRNGARWRALRARVLLSEDVCGICGRLVDKDLPPLDPGAPQIDHIIPLSRGGAPYARANVQLAHRRCNRMKSAGVDAPINTTTRQW